MTKKLGVTPDLERAEDRIAPIVGKEVAAIVRNDERNRKMREIKRAIRAAPDDDAAVDGAEAAGHSEDNMADAGKRASRAQEILDGTEIKAVDTFEHPEYLRDALSESRTRLIIVSPWLRGTVMDHPFMSKLEDLLDRGVAVHIGWGISKDEREEPNADRNVLKRLEELGKRYPGLFVKRLGNTHAKVLISDSRYVVVTSFNWLSFRGDPKRTFRDERGTLVSKPEYVDLQAADWIRKFTEV